MSLLNDENSRALIVRPNSSPATSDRENGILDRMVGGALEIASRNSALGTEERFRIENYELRAPDYRQILRWSAGLGVSPIKLLKYLDRSGEEEPELVIDQGSITKLTWDGYGLRRVSSFDWEPGMSIQRLIVSSQMPTWGNGHALKSLRSLRMIDAKLPGNDLDLSPYPNLDDLRCDGSGLTSIDLSPVKKLTQLDCSINMISELNLASVSQLRVLRCSDNCITEINLSSVPNLRELYCGIRPQTGRALERRGGVADLYPGRFKHLKGLSHVDLFSVPLLTKFWCCYGNLVELDLSSVTLMRSLGCDGNQLADLDLSRVPLLTNLSCSKNKLTKINLSAVPKLQSLSCSENQLDELDLMSCSLVEEVYCWDNRLKELDLSPVPDLKILSCENNQLKALDLSPVSKLTHLDCSGNNLSELNLTRLRALERINCRRNQITELDLRPLNNPDIVVRCDPGVRIIR